MNTAIQKFSRVVSGPSLAKFILSRIVNRSQWFEFTPLPNDEFEICLKPENATWFDGIVEEFYRDHELMDDYRQAASDRTDDDDELQVDEGAIVSLGDSGAWVQTWTWVIQDELS